MAATDRRPLLVAAVLVVGLAVVGLVVLGRADRAGDLGPPPATSRDDVEVEVSVAREDGVATVDLVVAVADGADDGLRVVDWGGGDRLAGPDPWAAADDAGLPRRRWTPAVQEERAVDPPVLHVGVGQWVDPEGVDRSEPPSAHERTLRPGQEVDARVWLDDPPSGPVRVCVWAAGTDPGDPGDRPVACAEDRL